MMGSGKYDDLCTMVREMAGAEGAIVIIANGLLGGGFSAQLPTHLLAGLPDALRQMADEIEADRKVKTEPS